MYDRQTESWWQQFAGDAITGELTGASLRILPSRILSFSQFRAAFPSGQVLVPNAPNFRPYGNNPYAGYDTADAPFLFHGDLPDNVPAMAYVVVARSGGSPIIVTLNRIRQGGFEKDGFRFEYSAGVASALDSRTIADGRETGTVRVTKDGKDVVHDLTFAFVAHAFHPETPIIAD